MFTRSASLLATVLRENAIANIVLRASKQETREALSGRKITGRLLRIVFSISQGVLTA
jgi:hypothetical protein